MWCLDACICLSEAAGFWDGFGSLGGGFIGRSGSLGWCMELGRLGMEALGAWTWMHCMDGSISWGSSLITKT